MRTLKTGMVALSEIAASEGLRLDAEYYLNPTLTVDEQIARCKAIIEQKTKRLAELNAERERILEDARRRGRA